MQSERGDIVLYLETNVLRNRWPLGRVVKVYYSPDHLVRSVDVKTQTGIYKRPITKLCVIENI